MKMKVIKFKFFQTKINQDREQTKIYINLNQV